jgi:hypothetical protein
MDIRSIAVPLAILLFAGCSQRDKKPRLPLDAVVGTWRSAPDSAGSSTLPIVELRADSGGSAQLTVTAPTGTHRVARGTWDGADSLVRVVVQLDTGIPRPSSLLFAFRGDALAPTAVSGPMLGPDAIGLRLRR